MNIFVMHMGENPVLKDTEHCSWVKRLLVRTVIPKAEFWLKVKAQGLASIYQEKQGQQCSFLSETPESKAKGIKGMGCHVGPSGSCPLPSFP